jgi:hypothetical protein
MNLYAQEKDSLSRPKIQFCSKNEFGVWFGIGSIYKEKGGDHWSNSSKILEMTTSNGIQYDRLFVGLGIGIRKWDNNYLIPLFFNSSVNLWKNKNSLFLHLDLGHQFGSRKTNYFGDKETGSFYLSYGLGYDFTIAKRLKLYLKTSISHQSMKSAAKSGLGPSNYMESYNPRYLFFRISLGLKFTK